MHKVILISCVKQKLKVKAQAKDLYTRTLFRRSLAFAKLLEPNIIYLLSAKHGLLELDDDVEPYDYTLRKKSDTILKSWSVRTLKQLSKKVDLNNDEIIFLAGENYKRHLLPYIAHYKEPLKGMTLWQQLEYMTDVLYRAKRYGEKPRI